MFNSFFKFISGYFSIMLIFIILVFFLITQNSNATLEDNFMWPLDGYTYISSYFGYRNSPTSGASTYHSGIDIPAPEGTNILAVCSGTVTFASWGAGGGYTIVIENDDIKVSYCHVSPNFIVSKYDTVVAGQIIANVGPKNVYGIINNPYKDSLGKPTNGATTRLPFTFNNKKRWFSGKSAKLFQYVLKQK